MILKEHLSEMMEKKLNPKMSKPQQVEFKIWVNQKKESFKKKESIKRWSMDSYLVVDGITKWSDLKA